MGRRYWLLLTAFLASSFGTWIYRLALPLLVYDLTGSALGTGLVYVMEYLPYLALGMVGGVLADRLDRRRLLVAGDLLSGAITVLLAGLVAAGVTTTWPLYAVAFLLACVDPLYQPAFRSIVPALVPVERLPQANARLHVGEHAVNMIGPVAGGAIVVGLGYQAAVYVDAATFLVSALLIWFVRTAPQPAGARGRLVADVREGLRFLLRGDRVVLTTALYALACNFGVWLLLAGLVYYLSSYHGFTPGQIGVVYAFQGAGAVLGAWLGSRLIRRVAPVRVVCWAIAAGGLSMLALVVARGPVAIGLAWMGQFAAAGTSIVATVTVRQLLVPDHLLGRVIGTARTIAFLSIPLASVATGVFESRSRDAYALMAVAGVSWLVIAAAVARSPLRRVRLAELRPERAAGSGRPAASPPPDPG
ncbi:MFS transporter [Actinomadura sp. ATCC 31491]|uniref:MFS transporter n=1 Tax=Actinomadura luzonensis TaxID=2805427 RepID=A0ABT0FL86_9ACTN|nr:MFS transporter [Actinomadura luzonensis]MCK2212698.1 MFS transporter [Actinomadura luzonensis]